MSKPMVGCAYLTRGVLVGREGSLWCGGAQEAWRGGFKGKRDQLEGLRALKNMNAPRLDLKFKY